MIVEDKGPELRRETWRQVTSLGVTGIYTVTDDAVMKEVTPKGKPLHRNI